MLQEKLRRLVEQWPARDLGAPGNLDQPALHQGLQNAFDRHPADRFDIGAGDRLAVGDDRESLERGRREPGRFRGREKLPHPAGKLRIAGQLPAFRFLKELKGALLLEVFDLQLLERRGHLRLGGFRELVRREFVFRPRAPECRDELARGERFLRAEKQRFDNKSEFHGSLGTYTTYSPIAL